MLLLILKFESHTHINWKKLVIVVTFFNPPLNIQSTFSFNENVECPVFPWNDTTSLRITGYEIKIQNNSKFSGGAVYSSTKATDDIHQICRLFPAPGAAPFPTLRPNRWWNRWAGRSSVWPGVLSFLAGYEGNASQKWAWVWAGETGYSLPNMDRYWVWWDLGLPK